MNQSSPTQAPTTGVLSIKQYVFVYLCLLSIALVPLFLTDVAPLVDFPNHLARSHILSHHSESADLQRFYTVCWSPLPNLAMDLIVPTLSQFCSVKVAARVFLGLLHHESVEGMNVLFWLRLCRRAREAFLR